MSFRIRLLASVFFFFGVAGQLLSEDGGTVDPAGTLKSLQETLGELQREIKSVNDALRDMSRNAKANKDVRPVAPTQLSSTETNLVFALEKAQAAYQRGRKAEDQKAYSLAIQAFTETAEQDPKNDSAFLHRAHCYYELKEYVKAIADLTQSLTLQPNDSQAYAMRAKALAAVGQTVRASLDVNEAIQRDPNSPPNYLLRAGLEEHLGHSQEALNDYTKAISLDPRSQKAFLGRAAILRTQGEFRKSIEDCYEAIQINPAEPAAYLCRAQFYLETGNAQGALEDISRAMLMGSAPPEIAPLLASTENLVQSTCAASPNRSDQAKVQAPPINTLPSQEPISLDQTGKKVSVEYYYQKGRGYADQGKFKDALAAFDDALQLDSKHARARNARGYVLLRLHQYQDALADFTEAIRLNPRYANAYRNRSAVWRSLGENSRAQLDFRQAVDLSRIAEPVQRNEKERLAASSRTN